MMNVVFRTDASLNIGSGHVMRCLTLAGELTRKGRVVVLFAENKSDICLRRFANGVSR